MTNDGKDYKEMYEMIPQQKQVHVKNVYFGQKFHISLKNRQQQQEQFFFVTGPQATTSGLEAIPAEADIRDNLGHEIRTGQERSRTNTSKNILFIFSKSKTIISAKKEKKI